MENNLELRMYSLVLYNISSIQQGIQAYHATIEATQNFNKEFSIDKNQFDDWAKLWKTVIILNGGSTVTMNQHLQILRENKIKYSRFNEPDLNDSLTAISFIVDERVFDKKKYPDYINHELEFKNKSGIIGLSSSDMDDYNHDYKIWLRSIGGEQNAFLRIFLSQFKLA